MPPRDRLKAIAAQTCEIIERGMYKCHDGSVVDIANAIVTAKKLSTCWASFQELKNQARIAGNRSRICAPVHVTAESTIACTQRLRREMGPTVRISVLNFASAKNPGGGFQNGAVAQEESLCRASALYGCLMQHFETFYTQNRQTCDGIYSDHIIWSPQVPVFRDDPDEDLSLDPYEVSFITLPAVNAGVVAQRFSRKDAAEIVKTNMRRRIRMILHLAAAQQTDVLILGAFGCGCFQNSCTDVARLFAEELQRNDAAYRRTFQQIVFAIYDTTVTQETMQAFRILEDVLSRLAGSESEDCNDGAVADEGCRSCTSGAAPSAKGASLKTEGPMLTASAEAGVDVSDGRGGREKSKKSETRKSTSFVPQSGDNAIAAAFQGRQQGGGEGERKGHTEKGGKKDGVKKDGMRRTKNGRRRSARPAVAASSDSGE